MEKFELGTDLKPDGDQPKAIEKLSAGREKSMVAIIIMSLVFVSSSWTVALADEPKSYPTQTLFETANMLFPFRRTAVNRFLVDPSAQIFIEGNEAGYSTLASALDFPRLEIVFGDPNGRRIDPKHLPDDPSVRMEARGGGKFVLVIDNPPAGRWTLEVTLPEQEKEQLMYFVDVFAKNATYSVAASLDRRIIRPGESVRAEIRIARQGEPYPDVTVTGILGQRMTHTPVGEGEPPVTFRDDGTEGDRVSGDAVYTAIIRPSSPGSYDLHYQVTDEKNFQRVGSLDIHAVLREAKPQ